MVPHHAAARSESRHEESGADFDRASATSLPRSEHARHVTNAYPRDDIAGDVERIQVSRTSADGRSKTCRTARLHEGRWAPTTCNTELPRPEAPTAGNIDSPPIDVAAWSRTQEVQQHGARLPGAPPCLAEPIRRLHDGERDTMSVQNSRRRIEPVAVAARGSSPPPRLQNRRSISQASRRHAPTRTAPHRGAQLRRARRAYPGRSRWQGEAPLRAGARRPASSCSKTTSRPTTIRLGPHGFIACRRAPRLPSLRSTGQIPVVLDVRADAGTALQKQKPA